MFPAVVDATEPQDAGGEPAELDVEVEEVLEDLPES